MSDAAGALDPPFEPRPFLTGVGIGLGIIVTVEAWGWLRR